MALVLTGMSVAWASAAFEAPRVRIVLVPLDDRPATSQFARMIGRIADAEVVSPPDEMLGHFTRPGRPDAMLAWLDQQLRQPTDAILLSTDMLAYGGLIASRVPDTPYPLAIERLRSFQRWRRNHPNVKVYAYSAIMRLSPTATKTTAPWREQLARYAEVKYRYHVTGSKDQLKRLRELQAQIPKNQIARYETARERTFKVQQELVRMTHAGVFNFLLFGQDDATPIGPHMAEVSRLRTQVGNLKLTRHVMVCQGVDQLANLLLARAICAPSRFSPRVKLVFSDENGRRVVAPYEAWPFEQAVASQLAAANAQIAGRDEWDFALYVNTPKPREGPFRDFVRRLHAEIDGGYPVAVADGNLGKNGSGDPDLFRALVDDSRASRLLGYAAWNTASNTTGTAIPTAAIYLLSRREGVDPFVRELNHRAFLLHRLVNDFQYHRFTRPQAFAMLDANPRATREETYGADFDPVDEFVRQDMLRRLDETFREQFLGRRFYAGSRQYALSRLANVNIELPWPRAYEVRIDFRIEAGEVYATSQ